MKINLDVASEEVRIEIIPLIDVIFCILTFFILAAVGLTRQQAIEVDLPRAATGQTQTRQILIVTLTPAGQLYVDKNPVSEAQLVQEIQVFRQLNPMGRIVLYASQSAFYSDVIMTLDLLRSLGGDRVVLGTLPPSGDRLFQPGDSPSDGTGLPPLPDDSGLPPLPNTDTLPPDVLPPNALPPDVLPPNTTPPGLSPLDDLLTPRSPGNPGNPAPTAPNAPGNAQP
jgi:biopolymer transport protein ExbD